MLAHKNVALYESRSIQKSIYNLEYLYIYNMISDTQECPYTYNTTYHSEITC